MELGKKIKTLRLKAGMTQEQLAEKLGIGAQAVSKWENAVAMPDISLLPELAEIFGVSIDDLFDLTAEQRFNRIESRMDIEEELPADVFIEYEEFLKSQLAAGIHKKRATELIAYLYWHRMNAAAAKVRRYAKEAISLSPDEKKCQWMLTMAEHHAPWDWNIANHSKAIDFYRGLVEADPECRLPYVWLIDNLLADHRADEAEKYLAQVAAKGHINPVLTDVYPAYIALARFDEKTADSIMEKLIAEHPDHDGYLFETAQYFAKKCDYDRAICYYERAFDCDPKRPRFIDALQGIADVCEIRGDFSGAAAAYGRIVDLLEKEWGMTEEVELKDARAARDRLLAKAK